MTLTLYRSWGFNYYPVSNPLNISFEHVFMINLMESKHFSLGYLRGDISIHSISTINLFYCSIVLFTYITKDEYSLTFLKA